MDGLLHSRLGDPGTGDACPLRQPPDDVGGRRRDGAAVLRHLPARQPARGAAARHAVRRRAPGHADAARGSDRAHGHAPWRGQLAHAAKATKDLPPDQDPDAWDCDDSVFIEAAGFAEVLKPVVILSITGFVTFVTGLRLFRWY